MKKIFNVLAYILPHILIILALMFITFFIIDKYNSAMEFINNDISKGLIFVWSIISVISACYIMYLRERGKRK